MLPVLHGINAAGDPAAMRLQLADLLGLDEPVAPQVLDRARFDDHYASYLLRSRGHPELLAVLMAAAGTPGEITGTNPEPRKTIELSNIDLLKKAGSAMIRWGSGGFQQLDPAIVERRNTACAACPHLRDAPDRLLYKVTLSARSDQRVCGACGCTASRKASLPDEACPVEDSENPGFTRWHEPLRSPPQAAAQR